MIQTLKKRSQFRQVQKGRKWVTPAFIMYGLIRDQSDECGGPRFGFTVSSRAVETVVKGQKKRGKAVDRNRAKRRIKEAVRLTFEAHAKPCFDYVIIGRSTALDRKFVDLLADMQYAFHKVGVSGTQSFGTTARLASNEKVEGFDRTRVNDKAQGQHLPKNERASS